MWTTSPCRMLKTTTLLLACTALAQGVEAAPITYHTRGEIWPWTYGNGAAPGYSGTNVITFQGVPSGSFTAPSPFPLGAFVVAPLPEGTSTTYHNTAFSIVLDTEPGGSAVATHANDSPFSSLHLYGVLNGMITGAGQSSVTARVLSIEPNVPISTPEQPIHPILDLPFPLEALTVDQPLLLAPSSLADGRTILTARISSVPEPASWLVLLTTLAGPGLRRRCRARI